MKKLLEQIRAQIEKDNTSCKARADKHRKPMVFYTGDLVWLYLRENRFSSRRQKNSWLEEKALLRCLNGLKIISIG